LDADAHIETTLPELHSQSPKIVTCDDGQSVTIEKGKISCFSVVTTIH